MGINTRTNKGTPGQRNPWDITLPSREKARTGVEKILTRPVFKSGDMEYNFSILLEYFDLLPEEINDVNEEEIGKEEYRNKRIQIAETNIQKLIPSFSFSRNGMESTRIEVGEGKYKSALLLLFLAEGKKTFHRSSTDRELIEIFFTQEIVQDAKNPELNNHSIVRALLGDGSLKIEIW